ncbi:proton-translocating NADH-quinone oxidoreductase, chain N [Chloroherpeton thalassium ATCC 35110]|uniref:NADH-quinone oxidoreductase subunit N 2 n=1 Tax=Chloroherpeton thalassium (strain ATCC 35110 / GB-78) TaxID=517418 RepID=NUON2_CHLT3|nr:NADH-quinone oxidoreductase subunit N [Chloroherpeton thalassium]B3QY38.1 RecName: Full=NADH-quinone oxidoreductase subunit N 2; AltName: Full=NADH dehydrogenase I subunit N 2; AltName: Full=NDH-1 subunit N 2 [Chloroherpeton thalassium ATCC 35110]ACF15004.1 proton-translocating NADH-quinone oxidoreductase, chain N [Chloroherpeton thalassium ATCC 35110]
MFQVPSAGEIQELIGALKTGASAFVPEIFLSGLFLLVVTIDLFRIPSKRTIIPAVSVIGLIISGYFVYLQHAIPPDEFFLGMYAVDPFAIFFKYLFIVSGVFAVLISIDSVEVNLPESRSLGEYYSLIVAMVLGMFLMASSTDLLMMFLSLEMVSIISYILVGYLKGQVRSSEAGLKYVIYGSVSSGLMIYGFSIIYGLTGETNIFAINEFLKHNEVDSITLMLGSLLILGGFGYKAGVVPFHFWSPDVYEGAPTPITAYLSVGSKAAGFAMLIRFFRVTIPTGAGSTDLLAFDWVTLLSVVSVVSMVLGNVVALWQSNVKRLLAYSSIAHAGYILLGVIVADDLGTQATLFYLAAYTIMNIGAFFVIILISNEIGSDDVNDYKGLGKKMPLAAASLTIFLVSLTGLPPTVGFIGKLMIFSALLAKGPVFVWLAVIGVLTSVVSLYFYFKIPLNMYLRESEDGSETEFNVGMLSNALVAFLMILTVVFGLYFTPLSVLAEESVKIIGAVVMN